jgi:hypothetical protein
MIDKQTIKAPGKDQPYSEHVWYYIVWLYQRHLIMNVYDDEELQRYA